MKGVVIFSGGLDSTVLLYHELDEGREILALSIDYGQRHKRELTAARLITEEVRVDHHIVDLSALAGLIGTGSSQADRFVDVPEGHYAADTMKRTVVPNRNMILLAVAGGYAISRGCEFVAYAAHAGDHHIYPDCRPVFATSMKQTLSYCNDPGLYLHAPFITHTKADIVRKGAELRVPFDKTWSCYKGRRLHCGRCGTCVERAEAFALAGIEDPTFYDDPEFWKTALEHRAKEA